MKVGSGSILDIRGLPAHSITPSDRNRPQPAVRRTWKPTFERPDLMQLQTFARYPPRSRDNISMHWPETQRTRLSRGRAPDAKARRHSPR